MEKEIQIDGLTVYYHMAGNKSNPLLVFLHAWGAQPQWLQRVVEAFAKDFYVMAPEHPGLLRSETPRFSEWSFEDYAHWLDELLKQLDISKPLLVGNSFGGGIATAYAQLYPQNVQALFLVDSVMAKEYGVTPFVAKRRARHIKILKSRWAPLFYKKLLLRLFLGTPLSLLTKAEVERKIAMFKCKWELNVDYTKLVMPVFLIWGIKDTFIHPIEWARRIAKRLPNGKLIEYDGNLETIYKRPEKVTSIIKSHIRL